MTKLEVERAIARLKLEASVELDARYHDKDELLHDLAKADIAVFAYGSSAEGGSGAVSDAIAVGLPVIVSGSSIFDDVRDVALTSAVDAHALADTLIDVLTSKEKYQTLARSSWAYAEQNSWKAVIDSIAGSLAASALTQRR